MHSKLNNFNGFSLHELNFHYVTSERISKCFDNPHLIRPLNITQTIQTQFNVSKNSNEGNAQD